MENPLSGGVPSALASSPPNIEEVQFYSWTKCVEMDQNEVYLLVNSRGVKIQYNINEIDFLRFPQIDPP